MRKIGSPRLLFRRSGIGLLALVMMVSLLSVMTTNVFAGSVNVYDFAKVLNQSQVSNEASAFPYAVDIYTTNTFTGSKQQFASETDGKINQNNKVVMAIDVRNHYVYLDGRGVSLSKSQYQDAANAFSSSYRSNPDYSGATVAAIDSLRGNSNSGNTGVSGYAPGGNSFGLSALCCIGLLVLAGLAVFGIVRGRRRGTGFFNRGSVASPYNQYNQGPYPPNYQGPYPPNYGPGYPNYNQGGMNPLAAGGLGAAAGGFLGYELGKEQGERQEREEDGFNQGGNYGGDGGAGSNFGGDNNGGGDWGGGGAGADFGGGNNGGGDFGGGGGSDFGGGGGGDNGGGAGSNF